MHAQKQSRRTLFAALGAAALALSFSSAAYAFENPQVALKTTMGEIVVELDQEHAPKSTRISSST
jgi:peptidyl-prolyl cis-trans isomerase A (cyclophilin A)